MTNIRQSKKGNNMPKKKETKLSIKLTNSVRDSIISKILTNSLTKENDVLEGKRFAFSLKVYNDFYSKKMRDQMQALPEGWLPETESLYYQFGSSSSGYCRRNFKVAVRVLAKHNSRNVIKVYADNDPYTLEHDALTAEVEKFKEKRDLAHSQIKGVVYSCSTSKALKEVWPEISSIVEEFEPTEKAQGTSVAPILADLNKVLGL